jgi:hypothetical protein
MQGKSTKVSRKRARMSKSKCQVLLRRSGLDFKESWKIRTVKY